MEFLRPGRCESKMGGDEIQQESRHVPSMLSIYGLITNQLVCSSHEQKLLAVDECPEQVFVALFWRAGLFEEFVAGGEFGLGWLATQRGEVQLADDFLVGLRFAVGGFGRARGAFRFA